MGKNEPIKFFTKRIVDNCRTEGGGNDKLPKWILQGEELKQRSEKLCKSIDIIEQELSNKNKEEQFIPGVIKARINDNAKAKSHRCEIDSLFRIDSDNPIIGLDGDNELLIKVSDKSDFKKIKFKLQKYDEYAHAISSIENIERLKANIIHSEQEKNTYKIKLIKYYDYDLDNLINRTFEKKCDKLGLNYKKSQYTDDLIVYKINNVTLDKLEEIENYSAIFSVEPMPLYSIDLDFFDVAKNPIISMPVEGENYVTVGVLDSGISKIDSIRPWLDGERQTFYPSNLIDESHGTFVAGVILYGDILEDKEYTGLKGCKIFDANVFPDLKKESIDEDELIYNIREVIKNNYQKVKIWNLSGGLKVEIDDYNFSDFAQALDDIQDSYDVIICKSAGNCTNFLQGLPKGKIVKSADSVRAIVVGSIAHEKNEISEIDVDYPSPFTRIGRGPASIIKPDVVHYGGNAGVDENGNLIINGVKSFDLEGKIIKNIGTSFSTPRVTAILAGLQQEIAEEFDPLLLKTLLIHSASYGNNINMSESDRLNQLGFGKPKKIREILYNNPNEITLIMRDNLKKGQYIDILDFPFPKGLKKDGMYTGQIIVTLVYNPLLENTQGSEYCQSNIDIYFGSYDQKKTRDISKSNILNPIGRENSKNILSPSCYSKSLIKNSKGNFALNERMLITYGDKFYPVKKYAVDLSEITSGNKQKYLTGEKLWYLKVEGLYRDFIERKAMLESTELSQEFCLAITIRDPEEKCMVYDEVTRLLDLNNFWHNNIKLRQSVNVRIDT